jgi:hypothetical protein
MKRNERKIDDLETRLFDAYRAGEYRAPGAGWRASVMREIRLRGAVDERAGVQQQIGRFAWRFSAVAAIIALLLLVYVFSSGIVDYQDIAIRYLENPIEFII